MWQAGRVRGAGREGWVKGGMGCGRQDGGVRRVRGQGEGGWGEGGGVG